MTSIFQQNREITITMSREQLGNIFQALAMAAEYIEPEVDVKDGDDGVPMPNEAMCAMQDIDVAYAIVEKLWKQSEPT